MLPGEPAEHGAACEIMQCPARALTVARPPTQVSVSLYTTVSHTPPHSRAIPSRDAPSRKFLFNAAGCELQSWPECAEVGPTAHLRRHDRGCAHDQASPGRWPAVSPPAEGCRLRARGRGAARCHGSKHSCERANATQSIAPAAVAPPPLGEAAAAYLFPSSSPSCGGGLLHCKLPPLHQQWGRVLLLLGVSGRCMLLRPSLLAARLPQRVPLHPLFCLAQRPRAACSGLPGRRLHASVRAAAGLHAMAAPQRAQLLSVAPMCATLNFQAASACTLFCSGRGAPCVPGKELSSGAREDQDGLDGRALPAAGAADIQAHLPVHRDGGRLHSYTQPRHRQVRTLPVPVQAPPLRSAGDPRGGEQRAARPGSCGSRRSSGRSCCSWAAATRASWRRRRASRRATATTRSTSTAAAPATASRAPAASARRSCCARRSSRRAARRCAPRSATTRPSPSSAAWAPTTWTATRRCATLWAWCRRPAACATSSSTRASACSRASARTRTARCRRCGAPPAPALASVHHTAPRLSQE